MKHTLGPWQTIADNYNSRVYYVWPARNIKSWQERIAIVYSNTDARLIAAAPELLEAVRTLLQLVPHFPEGGVCAKQVDVICQLIAKVEGGTR